MNGIDLAPILNTGLILALWAFVVTRERRWTGPSQHARLKALEDGHVGIELRLGRAELNMTRWTEDQHRASAAILHELQAIRDVKLGDVSSIRQELEAMKDAMSKIEQDLALIPCALGLKKAREDGTC